ncbi:ribosome small subunit-dependent GTPase A [Salirhabdus salicampi]|uniref:ribosome small subunit-dependent GTPase A n=1 Tax=Salirhabdus salicampi TaxID=476102 RepID=UPI0020C2E8D1|nr:ribosome small subunit-dependent GTPase A [Salirhabdus salicampi]MCP8616568.1 ribosome small subunit-dependent GTPase A [Salirhabdus salicampi]
MTKGKIVKALSGFYYVQTDDEIYQCRGRGLFRKKKVTPLVGDYVEIDVQDDGDGYVTKIMERNNELIRPPIANVDQAFIVSSAVRPDFSPLLLDRFLVLVESKQVDPVIIITKMDLASVETVESMKQYQKDYEKIGYHVILCSTKHEEELNKIIPFIDNKTSVIAGQSGVGKSSILNELNSNLRLETNDISQSLGRGKHTTRHVELMKVSSGYVADTPGFSSLEFSELEVEDLPNCFPEMVKIQNECKFRGCLHNREPKCAVKEAVNDGEIPPYRYDHYLQFLEEIQNRKPRY